MPYSTHNVLLQNMVEGLPNIRFLKGICKGYLIGEHLNHKFEKGKANRTSYLLGTHVNPSLYRVSILLLDAYAL